MELSALVLKAILVEKISKVLHLVGAACSSVLDKISFIFDTVGWLLDRLFESESFEESTDIAVIGYMSYTFHQISAPFLLDLSLQLQ